ncbi:MAG TPA: aminotransferase class IV [Sedimentisphaerales bacterium]|nr:aminotransferase class IV [Sedimentisphaerales bacterium]
MEKVFLNDKLVDAGKASVSISDSGLLYGAGLFETMQARAGRVFALKDHLDRLFSSAETLSINIGCEKEYISDAIDKVLRANNLKDARLRLTVTGGAMAQDAEERKSTLLITAAKLTAYPPEYYRKGVMVLLCPYRQNENDPTCGHKVTSYFPRMIGLKHAHEKGAAEALWFTTDNRLAEGCISNVFLVKDSVLYTPPVSTPVLAGVARKAVCRIAVDNSIELVEKDLYIDDVLNADEIFLTNVIMQVMPVNSVEKHAVGEGKVGPMAKKLKQCFDQMVARECRITNDEEADEGKRYCSGD